MWQQGQVFELTTRGRDGERFWAYRFRVGGRGSRQVQRGGFASERDAHEALERGLERVRRERRARKRDPSTRAELTEQELQIARFVAEGLTKREVAAQLFLSPRTIDFHLRNVYKKLGISSRTALARLDLDSENVSARHVANVGIASTRT
jgi:DNA-binding CsgD family transcriptional regulator